jgi:hypothetical protein
MICKILALHEMIGRQSAFCLLLLSVGEENAQMPRAPAAFMSFLGPMEEPLS